VNGFPLVGQRDFLKSLIRFHQMNASFLNHWICFTQFTKNVVGFIKGYTALSRRGKAVAKNGV
jgi:hypothetical protein